MHNEDYDIKIFTPIKSAGTPEPVIIADEMKRQVVSGNMQKASRLGEAIADSFREAAEKDELLSIAHNCGVELSREIKNQAIILSVFTAEYAFNKLLNDPILSTTAVSKLYDTLTKAAPELYNNLLASTAFSFYYMNINTENVDADVIGKTFAVLCDDDNNEALFCYGKTVFCTSLEHYKQAIGNVDFI